MIKPEYLVNAVVFIKNRTRNCPYLLFRWWNELIRI